MKVSLERTERLFFYALLLFLPTQFGKHFWPSFTIVSGIRIDYLSPVIYFTDMLVVGLLVVWFYRLLKKDMFLPLFANLQPLGIYLIFLSLTVYLSENFLHGTYQLLKFIEFSLIFLYVAKQKWTQPKLEYAVLILGIGSVLESFLAIAQFINQGALGGALYFLGERAFHAGTPGIANASVNGELILRPYATFPHPNVLAGYLFFVMFSCLLLLRKNTKTKLKTFLLGVIVLGTIALFLTLSRVAIVLWGAVLVGFAIRKIKVSAAPRRIALIVFVSLFCMGGVFFLSGGGVIGSRILGSSLLEESATVRWVLTANSLDMVMASPFWGVGLGNFLPSLPSFQKEVFSFSHLQPVHNIFLLTAAETGIFGLLFLTMFLKRTYSRLWNLRRNKKAGFYYSGLLVLLTLVLLLGQFDHYLLTLQQGQLLFALLLGFCWAGTTKPS